MHRIYIGADHRGFEKKQEIVEYLKSQNYDVIDIGAFSYNHDDDYPDFAFSVSEEVAKDSESKGILLCGSSIGVCAAANKVKGIFASSPRTEKEAKEDREHHGGNVLCLSSDNTDTEEMKKIIKAWLDNKFLGEQHARRIEKIQQYENTHQK